MQLLLRFLKYDQYKHPIFIASNRKDTEIASFNKLRDYAEKIREKEYDTFNPIYYDVENQFASIRFKHKGSPLEFGAFYSIDFKITKKEKLSKIYVNCYIDKIKLISKAEKIDRGEELDFD